MTSSQRIDPNVLHRRSIRLRGYDYTSAGMYFVTIVTHGRLCLFGDVSSDEMRLNDGGELIRRAWQVLPNLFPAVAIDEFVVMPNHIHSILVINETVEAALEGTRIPLAPYPSDNTSTWSNEECSIP